MAPGKPIADKVLNLSYVHKLYIIHMPEFLSFDNHSRRHTLVAHCFRIGLMVLTILVNLIPHLRWRQTVVALDILRMNSLALQLPLSQPVVKGYVSSISDKLVSQAVDALGVGSMLAKHLSSPYLVLQVNRCAVQAPSPRPMVAL